MATPCVPRIGDIAAVTVWVAAIPNAVTFHSRTIQRCVDQLVPSMILRSRRVRNFLHGARRKIGGFMSCTVSVKAIYVENKIIRLLLTKGQWQKVLVPLHQLLLIDNVMAIDTFEGFGEMVIAAIAIDQVLNLLRAELLVGEDGQVGADGAENTVGAERDDAIVVFRHGAHDVIDVRLFLGEVLLVL